MKKKIIFLSLILGLLVLFITPITVNADWEDTSNEPVLTTEWDEYRIPANEVVEFYSPYFVVFFDIPLNNINDKVLVFNKYSVIEMWQHFAPYQPAIDFTYESKPSETEELGYFINNYNMTTSEKEDAYNRFFNSQYVFFTEDMGGVDSITLRLYLDSRLYSKDSLNYLEPDFYKDLVYLIPIEDLPALNSFNLISRKYYFKDYGETDGESYYFDFSDIPTTYDYFIFNFEDNVSKVLLYGPYAEKRLDINTDIGVRLIDRNDLNWEIEAPDGLDDGDYFIVYDYNYIINLKDSLSTGFIDSYNTGYNNGKFIGIKEGYDKGWFYGYENGYADGEHDGYELGTEEGTTTGSILLSVFHSVGTILDIELLPNIKIGHFVLIPLVFGIVMFIVGKRRDD